MIGGNNSALSTTSEWTDIQTDGRIAALQNAHPYCRLGHNCASYKLMKLSRNFTCLRVIQVNTPRRNDVTIRRCVSPGEARYDDQVLYHVYDLAMLCGVV